MKTPTGGAGAKPVGSVKIVLDAHNYFSVGIFFMVCLFYWQVIL
jgi:hypothetical protein